ncbi:hypothetical protein [Bradyrhizobium sp. ORS 111]|uniref:hypothetical protein n=1 Tax=Bradyrhizobium sp. ORS 111 TaxID=1685958 RepID=UPI003890CBF7
MDRFDWAYLIGSIVLVTVGVGMGVRRTMKRNDEIREAFEKRTSRIAPPRQAYDANRDLELAIDEVGRERVFARAREQGWTDNAAPASVKWDIVNELRTEALPRS